MILTSRRVFYLKNKTIYIYLTCDNKYKLSINSCVKNYQFVEKKIKVQPTHNCKANAFIISHSFEKKISAVSFNHSPANNPRSLSPSYPGTGARVKPGSFSTASLCASFSRGMPIVRLHALAIVRLFLFSFFSFFFTRLFWCHACTCAPSPSFLADNSSATARYTRRCTIGVQIASDFIASELR